MDGLSERDHKFLRVHCARPANWRSELPIIVHIGFGCMPGRLRVTTNIPIPRDEPEVEGRR